LAFATNVTKNFTKVSQFFSGSYPSTSLEQRDFERERGERKEDVNPGIRRESGGKTRYTMM
jgi:hypothetical protein